MAHGEAVCACHPGYRGASGDPPAPGGAYPGAMLRRARPVLALLALVAGTPSASYSAPAKYLMKGTLEVAGTAVDREEELRADAWVEPGAGPGDLVLRLAFQGHECRLAATRDRAGLLSFAPGQTCVLDIRSPEANGRVEVRLRSGRGRLSEDDLSLVLSSDVSGALTIGSAPIQVLGRTVPGTGGTEVPLRGEARATAEGRRDRSRAAER